MIRGFVYRMTLISIELVLIYLIAVAFSKAQELYPSMLKFLRCPLDTLTLAAEEHMLLQLLAFAGKQSAS